MSDRETRTQGAGHTALPGDPVQMGEPEATDFVNHALYPGGPIPPVGFSLTGESILGGIANRRTASELAFENALGDKKHPNYIAGDLVYEQLAWRFAYKDSLSTEDLEWLRIQGFAPGQIVHGAQGFAMMSFVPLPGTDRTPVIAFRGTNDAEDLMDDLNPMGVGAYQLAANEGKIAATLASLQGYAALPAVTGHSLGGALAQMAASRFPGMVSRIITFQAPGISKKMAGRIEAVNTQSVKAGKGIQIPSHHFSVKDDLVSMAGESHTPGEVTEIDMPGVNFFLKHVANEDCGNYASGARVDKPTSEQVDKIRVAVGRVLGRFESLRGSDRETYIKVWETVREALDNNASYGQLVKIISDASVDPKAKVQMLENLRQIHAAHESANKTANTASASSTKSTT